MQFLNDAITNSVYIYYSIPIFIALLGVYFHRRGRLSAYFVSLIALTMWGLSAFMNMWTGWLMGNIISMAGALFGATFMLVTEFIVPASLLYKRTTNQSLPIVVMVSVLMAVGLSVFSFWNGVAVSINKNLAEMISNDRDSQTLVKKLDFSEIKQESLSLSSEEQVQPLFDEINSIKGQRAYNLAGQDTGRTIWVMTNGCASGVYYTNPDLYSRECQRIKSLTQQVSEINERNKSRPKDVDEYINEKQKEIALTEKLNQIQDAKNNTIPFVDTLMNSVTEGKRCSLDDVDCIDSQSLLVKKRSNTIALYIAVFSEFAKNALVVLAIGLIVPNHKPRGRNQLVRFIKHRRLLKQREMSDKAKSHGKRVAELEFEKSVREEKKRDNIRILEAPTWMADITFDQLSLVLNLKRVMLGKTAPENEVSMLAILVCREYESGKQIAIHSTLNTIREKSEDRVYLSRLMGEFNLPPDEVKGVVKQVCKLHRLRDIVLPALEDAGIIQKTISGKNKTLYFFKKDEEIESLFKKAIKESGNV